MGNCWQKFLQCLSCFLGNEEEKRPLLGKDESRSRDQASGSSNKPSGTPAIIIHRDGGAGLQDIPEEESLLAEHDKKYTIHGEEKFSTVIKRTQSEKRISPVGSPRKYHRLASQRNILEIEKEEEIDSICTPAPTKRQLTAMELMQTETTYIRNLKIIIEIYKIPLEKAVERGEPILAAEDIRNIFGGISDILKVHTDIHQELSDVIQDWDEDCCLADIFIKYQSQLTKVYPAYVNYFDMGKDIILKQKKVNNAFNEFLINCFNNPTCLKQPLDALLIRPVQRLPSVSLLVNDLQRRTPEDLRDHTQLAKAKEALKQVLSHINEDKRKTEGKTKIFDILYEVDQCPVGIVSSNRLFVSRINVTTLNEGLYRTGERLALYLLTDMIEVSKFKRSPRKNSPLLKHIRTLQLSEIESVIDINDTEESLNMFAIKLKEDEMPDKIPINGGGIQAQSFVEKLCVCQALDDKLYIDNFLKSLVEQVTLNNKEINSKEMMKKMDPADVQPLLRKGSKVFRRSRGKPKRD